MVLIGRKSILVFITLFSFSYSASVRNKRDINLKEVVNDTAPVWAEQASNCSYSSIDVLLRDPSLLFDGAKSSEYVHTSLSRTGFVEILLPADPKAKLLCFPQTTEEYRQAYLLSHVICRQLGFMTVTSMNSIRIPSSADNKNYNGVRADSYRCSGQEQNISHCEFQTSPVERCRAVTELSCGDCQYSIKDSSGFVEVPGYPLVNLFAITCEWEFTVPEDYSIMFSFHHFQSLFKKSSNAFCSLQEPYMDILYGQRNRMRYRRYCNLQDVKNITITQDRVKVRIFTGLYQPERFKPEDSERGLAMSFYTAPSDKPSTWPGIVAFVALFLLIFIVISGLVHFCKKYEMCRIQRRCGALPTSMPNLSDVNRAYEFQRCTIQLPEKGPVQEKKGLRLRSNGSGEKSVKSCPSNNTFFISSGPFLKPTGNKRNLMPIETPKTIIPEIIFSGVSDPDSDPIDRVKVNLLDRYSKTSCDMSTVSGISSQVSSTSSPVFFPAKPSFEIYRSVSSEDAVKVEEQPPPPYDAAM